MMIREESWTQRVQVAKAGRCSLCIAQHWPEVAPKAALTWRVPASSEEASQTFSPTRYDGSPGSAGTDVIFLSCKEGSHPWHVVSTDRCCPGGALEYALLCLILLYSAIAVLPFHQV